MIACGAKDTEQKDTLELADVDYGSSGAFTINVWFRHDQENFENYQREGYYRLALAGQSQVARRLAGSPQRQ